MLGFPCSSAGKEPACNVGDLVLIPGLGRSPGEGKGYPLQYSGLQNSMDCIVHSVTESDTTEQLSLVVMLLLRKLNYFSSENKKKIIEVALTFHTGILNTREDSLAAKEFEWDCGKCSLLEGEKNKIRAISLSFIKARYLVLPNIFLNGDNIFQLRFLKLK